MKHTYRCCSKAYSYFKLTQVHSSKSFKHWENMTKISHQNYVIIFTINVKVSEWKISSFTQCIKLYLKPLRIEFQAFMTKILRYVTNIKDRTIQNKWHILNETMSQAIPYYYLLRYLMRSNIMSYYQS